MLFVCMNADATPAHQTFHCRWPALLTHTAMHAFASYIGFPCQRWTAPTPRPSHPPGNHAPTTRSHSPTPVVSHPDWMTLSGLSLGFFLGLRCVDLLLPLPMDEPYTLRGTRSSQKKRVEKRLPKSSPTFDQDGSALVTPSDDFSIEHVTVIETLDDDPCVCFGSIGRWLPAPFWRKRAGTTSSGLASLIGAARHA